MLRQKVNFILFWGILCVAKFISVKCDCIVKYPDDIEVSPIYKKVYGKYVVELPYNENNIRLRNGEYIVGECGTNFSSISYNAKNIHYYNDEHNVKVLRYQKSIRLQCVNFELLFKNSRLHETMLECQKLYWSIYDATESYEWCDRNRDAQTFLLATKSNQDYILAGICFDLKTFTLQTITYNVTYFEKKTDREIQRYIAKKELKSVKSLGEDLWNLKNTRKIDLSETDLKEYLGNLSYSNTWYHLANYEISSIVQGYSNSKYFREYDNILNTLWWRNLRLGNWRLFINTLENYAYNNSFQLYMGTSGHVKVPTENMNDFEVLEIKVGFSNYKIPAYIWTYLTSTDQLNEDFIIIAYNSPYTEFFNLSDIKFCPNICAEIPWLREIQKSFNISMAGIMFCCKPEFLQQTEISLEGFPMEVLKTRELLKHSADLDIEGTTIRTTNTSDEEATETNVEDGENEMNTTTTLLEGFPNELFKLDA